MIKKCSKKDLLLYCGLIFSVYICLSGFVSLSLPTKIEVGQSFAAIAGKVFLNYYLPTTFVYAFFICSAPFLFIIILLYVLYFILNLYSLISGKLIKKLDFVFFCLILAFNILFSMYCAFKMQVYIPNFFCYIDAFIFYFLIGISYFIIYFIIYVLFNIFRI